MKSVLSSPIPLAALLLFAPTQAFPQQTQPPAPQRYSSALYLKVQPDKDAAYVEAFKTGFIGRALRANLKANPKLISYSLRRGMYGGYPLPEANMVLLVNMNGAPQDVDTAKRDAIYKEAIGMSYNDFLQKVYSMSQVVGSTLSHVHHVTPDYQAAEGDIVVARRLKTAEGKSTDLANLNRDVRFPIATERAKSGAIKGWAFSHLAFPNGASLEWDATDTMFYKDLSSAFPQAPGAGGGGGGGLGGMALFTKMFPNRSFVRYQDDLRDFSKVVRTDMYRVISVIR